MTKWLDCFFKILAFLQENLTMIIIFSQSRFKTMPNTKSTLQKLPKPFKILPNIKSTLQKLPKTFKILPQWRKFAKSGHIDFYFKSTIKYVASWTSYVVLYYHLISGDIINNVHYEAQSTWDLYSLLSFNRGHHTDHRKI